MAEVDGGPAGSRWHTSWTFAAALILLGGVLIVWGVNASVLLLALIGIGVGAWGLGVLSTCLVPFYRTRANAFIGGAIGLVLFGIGMGVVLFAVNRRSTLLAATGVALVAVSVVPVGRALVRFAGASPTSARRSVVIGLGIIVLAVLLAYLRVPIPFDVLLLALGLLAYNVGLEPYLRGLADPRSTTVAVAIACGAGIAVLLFGVHYSRPLFIVMGGGLAWIALLPLSIGWRLLHAQPVGPWPVVVVGLALFAAGAVVWPDWDEPFLMLALVAGLLAGVAFSFSWRGEALILIVAVGWILIWSLSDRPDPTPPDPNPNATERILALGDSYTSGEGSTMFFPETNVADTNQCRRSSTAYPYLVAEQLHMGLDFFACSGAKTTDIYVSHQMPHSPPDVAGGLAQLKNPFDASHVSVVLISIGGNDAGFGQIGKACLLPGSCDVLRQNWLANVSHIGPNITEAFEQVREFVGESTPVVVVPYPLMISERPCEWTALSISERKFLAEFVAVMDDRVRHSAAEAGVNFFEPGLFAFTGRQICDPGGAGGTDMNFFNLHPQEGSLMDEVNPTNWIHGTLHPKPSGHAAIADRLTQWLGEFLPEVEAGTIPANPESGDTAFTIKPNGTLVTTSVDPQTMPASVDCPKERIDSFATLLPALDAEDDFPLNVNLDEPICYSRPDGTWASWRLGDPSPLTDDGKEIFTSRRDKGRSSIRIQPELPESGYRQMFVYAAPHKIDSNTTTTSAPQLQVRIVEFCNLKPGCQSDVDVWTANRIRETARKATVPALLIWIGGWLLGLGFRVLFRRSRPAPELL